jgi:alcohol dehydrogenase YqhD (iron-dependent ADH family)
MKILIVLTFFEQLGLPTRLSDYQLGATGDA